MKKVIRLLRERERERPREQTKSHLEELASGSRVEFGQPSSVN